MLLPHVIGFCSATKWLMSAKFIAVTSMSIQINEYIEKIKMVKRSHSEKPKKKKKIIKEI